MGDGKKACLSYSLGSRGRSALPSWRNLGHLRESAFHRGGKGDAMRSPVRSSEDRSFRVKLC